MRPCATAPDARCGRWIWHDVASDGAHSSGKQPKPRRRRLDAVMTLFGGWCGLVDDDYYNDTWAYYAADFSSSLGTSATSEVRAQVHQCGLHLRRPACALCR